jgi:IPT/TIG domain
VTFNQAAYPDVRILEYSGLSTSSPLDVTAAAVGSGSSASSGSATTTSGNELILGAGTSDNFFSGAGTGFTNRIVNIYGNLAEDKAVSSIGSYTATAINSGNTWVMQMATFKAASLLLAPTVTVVNPNNGPATGGTSITISGTNFVTGATASLGGASATNVVVVNSTTITATTAAHAAGAVTVSVTNPDTQSGNLTNGFTYTTLPAPTVTGVNPNNGSAAGGTAITISGTNFVNGATASLGGTAATNVVVVNSTTITATTAAHAAGVVTVTVTNPDTQSGSLTNRFTYTSSAPTVTGVNPNNGPVAGGTAITISGTNFVNGATASLGGTAATNVVVVNSTTITAKTAAHAAGAVTVTVTNPDTQSGSLANGYTYNATISFVQVSSGPSTIQSSNSSVSVAYGKKQTAGDLNIVVVGWGDNTSTISSVTDSLGNSYSRAVGPTGTSGLQQSIYYAKNIVGGNNTVKVTFNQAAAYPDVRILEYSGLSASNPLDVTAAAVGSGSSASSGSATTTSGNELIFGAGTSDNFFSGAGTGFTNRIVNIYGNLAEDKVVSSSGSYAATAVNSGNIWVMQMVTLK